MRTISLLSQLILFLIGIAWIGVIGWFVFSVGNTWSVFLFIIVGIFIMLAFFFCAYMLHQSHQTFGFPLVSGIVAFFLTALEFNYAFVKSEIFHNISIMGVMTLLFFLAIVKIWDTLDFWEQ